MRKSEVVDILAKQTGLPKVDIILVLETFLSTIAKSVEKDEPVYFRGFGTFQARIKKEKKGRIIKKNIEIIIPQQKTLSFKPSKLLIRKLNRTLK